MKPVIILGAGGHAKIVAEALIQSGIEVLGFVAPDAVREEEFFGYRILGNDDVVKTFSSDDILLANGIGMLPKQTLRWSLAVQMRKDGYSFVTVRHPSAMVARDVMLAEGVQVMAGAIIQPGTTVGIDSIINTGVLLDHDCSIANNCHLAPGVVCSGGVDVGEGVFLGAGALVAQNISVGKDSVLAAGSVVYEDVPSSVTFIQKRKVL